MEPPESAPASAPSLAQPDAPEPGPPPARCIACRGTGKLGWGPCQSCSGGGLSPAASSGASKCILCRDTGKGLFGGPCGRCSGGPGAAPLIPEEFSEKYKNTDFSVFGDALRGLSANAAGFASCITCGGTGKSNWGSLPCGTCHVGVCFLCNDTGVTGFGPRWRCPAPAAVPPRPSPAFGSTTTDVARVQAIAEKIKSLQRRRPDARIRWAAHCDACFEGTKDPGRHPLVSLADFALEEFLALDCDDDADDADHEDSKFFIGWLREYRASR